MASLTLPAQRAQQAGGSNGFHMLTKIVEYFELELHRELRDVSLEELLALLKAPRNPGAILVARFTMGNGSGCIAASNAAYTNIQCDGFEPNPLLPVAEANIYILRLNPSVKDAYQSMVAWDVFSQCLEPLYLAAIFFNRDQAVKGVECVMERSSEIVELAERLRGALDRRGRRTLTLVLNSLSRLTSELNEAVDTGSWDTVPAVVNELAALHAELLEALAKARPTAAH